MAKQQVHILGEPPECPICYKKMKKVVDATAQFFSCFSPQCMIWINVLDPMAGKWRGMSIGDDINCPLCNVKMRFFCRSDGYMKARCVTCGAGIETQDSDIVGKNHV